MTCRALRSTPELSLLITNVAAAEGIKYLTSERSVPHSSSPMFVTSFTYVEPRNSFIRQQSNPWMLAKCLGTLRHGTSMKMLTILYT